MKRFTVVILCLFGLAAAQADTAWVRYYNGPGNDQDMPAALVADGAGGVFVTGLSLGAGTAWDFATVHYNAGGETVWARRFVDVFDDNATALARDNFGNVIVTGMTGVNETLANYLTVKYDAAGDTVWARRYRGVPDRNCSPVAVATDPDGNVYVTGRGVRADWNVDVVTIKYSPTGESLWCRWFDGPTHWQDEPQAMVVARGAVHIAGLSDDSYLTLKCALSGETAWSRTYRGPGIGGNANAIAVDSSGNVYVAGANAGDSGYTSDFVTVKYDAAGTQQWAARMDGPAGRSDEAEAVAVAPDGSVCVTGWWYGNRTRTDFLTVRYSPAGDTLWTRTYNGPDSGYDNARALAVDGHGNCYVTGASQGTSVSEFLTIRYNANGDVAWMKRLATPSGGAAEACAVAVDANDFVFVTGHAFAWPGAADDYMTVKYVQAPGIQEAGGSPPQLERSGPAIVRGILSLPSSLNSSIPSSLLDASGRRVLTLHPGPNDVSRLAPGVYFMRSACRPVRVVVVR